VLSALLHWDHSLTSRLQLLRMVYCTHDCLCAGLRTWPAKGRYETKWYTSSFSLAPLDSSANDGSLPPAQSRASEGQAKRSQNKQNSNSETDRGESWLSMHCGG
jgi:hypothetical protein